MRVYLLLLFVAGCWGSQWKAINDFKEILKEYSAAAVDTISRIENILDTSGKQSELFIDNAYSNNPIVSRISKIRSSEKSDKCFEKFIEEENFKFSFQIQVYQLQTPLQDRIVDIRERLNDLNYSIDIYQGIAESKLQNCKSENGYCMEKTNEWLETTINSLTCKIDPNCANHFIGKRSTCSESEFWCQYNGCISSSSFCDGICNCGNCVDEPSGCTRHCSEFRCRETFRCISLNKKCNGIDECGDGSDEEGCTLTTTPSYTHFNCSIDAGDFLCDTNKCIGLERVCDGYYDCEDWSDEGDRCNNSQCSPECQRKGGVCFVEPKGSKCLYECPPGTYETSRGCSRNPEAPLPTLLQVLEDTPRLISRYAARLKYLKSKTIMALSKSLRDIVKCKKEEYTLLSKIIYFSTVINEEKDLIQNKNGIPLAALDKSDAKSETMPSIQSIIAQEKQFESKPPPSDYVPYTTESSSTSTEETVTY